MNLFKDLGTVEVRNEVTQEESDLEKVLNVELEVINKYKTDTRYSDYFRVREMYSLLYSTVEEKTKGFCVTKKILQSYINTRDNQTEDSEARIRGMYAAVLLEMSSKQEPNTHIILDGKEKTFNYLFHYVKNANNITIQNFKGKDILKYAGLQGRISHIICENITGDELLFCAAQYGGIAEYITYKNSKGTDSLRFLGSNNGNGRYIVCHNLIGDGILGNTGENGRITNVICTNITGDGTMSFAGSDTRNAEHIICTDIIGKSTLEGIGTSQKNTRYLSLKDIEGTKTLYNAGAGGRIEYLIFDHESGKHALQIDMNYYKETKKVKKLLRPWEISNEQKEKYLKIHKIAETIANLSFSEQKAAHEEIAELQKQIFRNRFQNGLFAIFEKTKRLFQRKNKKGET